MVVGTVTDTVIVVVLGVEVGTCITVDVMVFGVGSVVTVVV
jgi:hypothetical protein